MSNIYSIGHSSLNPDHFMDLLMLEDITAIADVRSAPYSKRYPWFNGKELKAWVEARGVSYVFLGRELGGRPDDPSLFRAGIADYEAMASTKQFGRGMVRLLDGAKKHRIALMCSERDPLHCHRCLMVGRQLSNIGINTRHIHHDGRCEDQDEAERRLMREEGMGNQDLLISNEDVLGKAYTRRSINVAYSQNGEFKRINKP